MNPLSRSWILDFHNLINPPLAKGLDWKFVGIPELCKLILLSCLDKAYIHVKKYIWIGKGQINVLLVQHQAPLSTMQGQPEPKEKLQPQNNDVTPYLEW